LQHRAAVLVEDLDALACNDQSRLETATRDLADLSSARQVD
jgi:hypothetical protein